MCLNDVLGGFRKKFPDKKKFWVHLRFFGPFYIGFSWFFQDFQDFRDFWARKIFLQVRFFSNRTICMYMYFKHVLGGFEKYHRHNIFFGPKFFLDPTREVDPLHFMKWTPSTSRSGPPSPSWSGPLLFPKWKWNFFLDPKLEIWDGIQVRDTIPAKILVTSGLGRPAWVGPWGLWGLWGDLEKIMENQWKSMKNQWKSIKIDENR